MGFNRLKLEDQRHEATYRGCWHNVRIWLRWLAAFGRSRWRICARRVTQSAKHKSTSTLLVGYSRPLLSAIAAMVAYNGNDMRVANTPVSHVTGPHG
jgi:pyrroloquinoline quinone (PQQ) biosynthesis protein C